MAVSESNLTCDLQVRACSNVHPADVRRSAWNGLCKISYGKYPAYYLLFLFIAKDDILIYSMTMTMRFNVGI